VTRGQLRLQALFKKMCKSELVENIVTEGDRAGMAEDKCASEKKPMISSYASDDGQLNNRQDQEAEGMQIPMFKLTSKKSGRNPFGSSANLEGRGNSVDNGQADEEIFTSKEQSELFARYREKVCVSVHQLLTQ
jgi:hypothetical protein